MVSNKIKTLHNYVLQINAHSLISLFLFFAGLYLYISTLAPTVIEGDAALFQYTPYALGVTYPTGFPLYILAGKLWVSIIPFGEIAWRMNLLSALCSATAMPLLYNATRRLFTPHKNTGSERWAALAAVLIFATLPTFWRWSTEAKTYALNILLFSGVLYTLARALKTTQRKPSSNHQSRFSAWLEQFPLALPAFLLGLQISVHNTGVLLIPGLALMAWLNFKPYFRRLKSIVGHLFLLAAPAIFYLYIPFRAENLIIRYTRQGAIEQGLLADFYTSGLAGLVSYFTASGFTQGVVTNWGLVPQQFFSVYIPLLIEDFTLIGAAMGVVGGLAFAISQPRLFFPLLFMYITPIPFVLTYGQGEQSAFLLPSFLIFAIFAGYLLVPVTRAILTFTQHTPRFNLYASRLLPPLLLLILIPLLFRPQIQHNLTWLTIKWNRDIYNEWDDALNHPLESGAGMLAHWGDLTSFWYMQHAEKRRTDLRGVYPPNEAAVINWFSRGTPHLYIAGPLQGWAAGIENRYQLVPWGRLVKIAPRQLTPQTLLPQLPYPFNTTFDDKIHLVGADFAAQAVAGQNFPVTLTWQALAELDEKTTVSLRLTQEEATVAQLDDPLRSGWFPRETMPKGQHILNYPLLHVPIGTLPGQYQLQLVTYNQAKQPWTLPDGSVTLTLGTVEIISPPSTYQLNPNIYKIPPHHDFNNEIELAGYNYSVSRVGQGKGFALGLLWQAKNTPVDNYTLLVELLDANNQVLRTKQVEPVGNKAPTASWQPGQFIRDKVNLVIPANTPPGNEALRVRLRWLRPNGTKLSLRRWKIPINDGLDLPWLRVTEKTDRTFTLPNIQHPLNANLENKVLLTGYNSPDFVDTLRLKQSSCDTGACGISLDFYWQALDKIENEEMPYQIFLHVVDENGQIITQQDHAPGYRGKQPTTGWLSGEVILDPVEIVLPPNIAPGQYTINVGMYLPPTGPRLSVLNEANHPTTDFVTAGTIEITPW